MRVRRQKAYGGGVEVGEVAAPAARDQYLLAHRLGLVEQQHAPPALPRDRGAHQPGRAGAQYDGVIIGGGHGDVSAASRSTARRPRSEEHTSELQSLLRISYDVFCLQQKTRNTTT